MNEGGEPGTKQQRWDKETQGLGGPEKEKEKDAMRVAKFLLAAVIVVGLTSTASAVNQVWWEATPNNADSSVVGQGAGQTLALECAANAARCEWSVTMFLTNTEILFSWGSDLAVSDPTIHVKDFQYEEWFLDMQGNGYYYPFTDPSLTTTVNGGVSDAGAFTLGQANPFTYPLFSFTLSKDKGTNWVPGLTGLSTFTSVMNWGGTQPNVWVEFGANAQINASSVGAAPASDVITINNVPEPATLALLGLGAFCLIRRRR
jgi:hypothetical protein